MTMRLSFQAIWLIEFSDFSGAVSRFYSKGILNLRMLVKWHQVLIIYFVRLRADGRPMKSQSSK
ncbi:hypothetical protein BGAL_0258g00140 [Botrytis galanthina]|uniref:Uncharacterized protein n=1 Tax=Botrytis galanthina TaxID=278940 RepID=A0A4S8QV37_9HELO|nr:hypothetical protein BGAL_0258g00140 [Botrytis galanthina]